MTDGFDAEATATVETRVSGRVEVELPTGTSAAGRSTAATPTTPTEALRLDEIRRIRLLAGSGIAVCVIATLALLPMAGVVAFKWAHLVTMGTTGGACAWFFIRIASPERYAPWMVTVLACFMGVGLAAALLFWGVFSSAVLYVPIVLYFVSFAESRWPALVILVFACLPHGVVGVLVTFSIINDPGVVHAPAVQRYEQLAVIGLAQFAFLVSYLLARMSRRSIQDAVEQLDHAVRGIARREALLVEVKQDLERALHVGGPGLYSGQTLGSFRLGNLLGRGAMGEVYEASHHETGDAAAVKVLTPGAGSNPDLVRRFVREVEIAGALAAPNIVRVLEVPAPTGTVPYLAMERLRGESLADCLRDRPRLRDDDAIVLLEHVTVGVSAAPAAGIVHRDLKPRNIFRHREGAGICWKVLDFGVSKLLGDAGTLTEGMLIGTPAYMAPEQARGQAVDARCDVYSLGVIAYRVLTGLPPFGGSDVPAVLYAVTHTMPPRPSSVADLPPAVDAVLAVALAKHPDDRFASATDLAVAIGDALRGAVDPDLVDRADAILATLDWGATG